MNELAAQGFLAALWALTRLISAAAVLIAGLAFFFRALFPPRKGSAGPHTGQRANAAADRGPALPRRAGLAELSRLCAGAKTRGYYRSLVAERLRALGRDSLALREDLSDEEAYKRLRMGRDFLDGDSAELLFGDHFALPQARRPKKFRSWFRNARPERDQDAYTSFVPPFLGRVKTYLRSLSDYMQDSGGNDGRHDG
jgi:hypothetical protein